MKKIIIIIGLIIASFTTFAQSPGSTGVSTLRPDTSANKILRGIKDSIGVTNALLKDTLKIKGLVKITNDSLKVYGNFPLISDSLHIKQTNKYLDSIYKKPCCVDTSNIGWLRKIYLQDSIEYAKCDTMVLQGGASGAGGSDTTFIINDSIKVYGNFGSSCCLSDSSFIKITNSKLDSLIASSPIITMSNSTIFNNVSAIVQTFSITPGYAKDVLIYNNGTGLIRAVLNTSSGTAIVIIPPNSSYQNNLYHDYGDEGFYININVEAISGTSARVIVNFRN